MGPFEIAAIAIIGGLGYAAYETHMKTKGKAGKADKERKREILQSTCTE